MHILDFLEPVRTPMPFGAFRRQIAPSERVLALINEYPGWEAELAMSFGTVPLLMRTTSLMPEPIGLGGTSCMPLDALARNAGWVPAARLRSIAVRLAALELRANLMEATGDFDGDGP